MISKDNRVNNIQAFWSIFACRVWNTMQHLTVEEAQDTSHLKGENKIWKEVE